ncbi:MAG: RHS repeat-associated core domain-containing protein [Chitinophagaceae bacterium]
MAKTQIKSKLLLLILLIVSILNSNAQNINKPNKSGPLGTQVNTFTGNLFIPRTDIFVPARGFGIDVTFNYNSFNFDKNNGYGNGWSLGYSIKYKNDTANSRTIIWGDGREDNYTVLAGGYKSPKGFFTTLTQYQPDKYLLTEPDGTKFYFDNSTHKRITKMEEPKGNYINFNYTDTLLTSLVNTAGQSISFTYNGTGHLATVVDAIAAPTRTYTYSYDGNGNLKEITDPMGGKNKYTYLVNGPMKTITDKNNNTVDIIYFNDFSVSELIGCNKRVSFSYDTATNNTIVTDHLTTGNNQATKYGYKKTGGQTWLSSISGNCCGYNMSFEFDDNGNKIKETDANGNIYNYTYDARGNMLTMQDPLNQSTTYTYSSNYNQVTSITDPKGNVYTLTYNAKGDITQLKGPDNTIYSVSYNANGDMISSTDPEGNVYSYSYDAYGNPASVSGPGGYHGTWVNDARGNLLSYTDSRGNTYSAQYDILNRLKKIIDPINNDLQLSYDAEGNIIGIVNKNNEASSLNYDASNRVVKFTDPKGNQTQIGYDGMDNVLSAKNALGNAMNFTYDTRNRLSTTKDALNDINTISYDANGNITYINLPNGQRVNFAYDNINRATGINDISGTIGNYTYDKNNNITSYTNGTGAVITAAYDSLNRVTKVTDPLGFLTLLSYDKNDNLVSVTDRNSAVVNYTYDSLNRIKTYTDKNGFIITVGYDAEGNVTQVKDPNNNITAYTYDSLNRLKTITYPDSRFIQYGFDRKSNIISKRLTDGTVINFQYDSLNRVISKSLPGGQVYSYGYDAIGRIISATNNNGTVTIIYDALNRIASETFDGRTTKYNYNIAGRTQTTIYPDSTVIAKNYDTRNRLISIAKNNTTIVSYQYNNVNQVIVKNFANGVSSNVQYDFTNRLSSISTAGGSIQNTSFTYDKERNKTTINRLNNPALSEQFTYDNGHRLINYKRGIIGGTPTIQNTYSYDAVGNRINANLNGSNTTYSSNNLNQLTNSNNGTQNINFVYDNNGNLTYDGAFYKTYDAEGRLFKDSSSPTNVLTYQYDALNRRVQKNFNGTSYKYSYSGLAQIEERNGATNSLTGRTVFTNFLTPVLNEKNNNNFYYHQNELNSVEAITNDAGNLTERYQYDVYGKPIIYDSLNNAILSSIAGNRFAFTGQEYDSANSSYRFQFRNYSPATGTFNQRDLIGYADGMGMYQYVHDNPANGIDILGLKDCPPENVNNATETEVSGNLSKVGNYLSMVSAVLNKLLEKEKIVQKKLDMSFKPLEKQNKMLGKVSLAGNIAGLTTKVDLLLQNYETMPEKDLYVELGEIELATAGILNDVALSKIPGAQAASAALSTAGTVDALVQETTGKSLSWWYAHQSDAPEALGNNAANEINASFNKREQTINEYAREHGTDINTWSMKMKLLYKVQQGFKKSKVQKNTPNGNDCPPNGGTGGTQKPNPKGIIPSITKLIIAVGPKDPNAIIGPDGEPGKRWVSVHDRLPYTILYENDSTASAPAKFVRVTSPIEPKQDAATFQLSSFGFNNQTFAVPSNLASYYQRLDCRDSMGLYVDITSGYDQINNVAFWEFQSIDPITLLPPADPLKGFLLLQDSSQLLYGHGFVNFSIKPIQTAITLDTIGARASIVFDFNDTIPTNIAMNTIDAFAPTSHMNALPGNNSNPVSLSWTGVDDPGGCGLKYYTLYVSTDGINFNMIRSGITRTDTTFTGAANTTYYFFVLSTDSVGNTEVLRPGEIRSTFIGSGGPLPVTWLYFNGTTRDKNNILDWATASEQNSKEFRIERSLNGTSFTTIGTVAAAGNSSSINTYQFTDRNIDRLNSNVMFYRLKQVDLDNNFRFSNIIRLTYNQNEKPKSIVYPNPTQDMITISVGDKKLIGTMASINDQNGRMIHSVRISANSQNIDFTKYLNGIYYIRLTNQEVLKVVKQ